MMRFLSLLLFLPILTVAMMGCKDESKTSAKSVEDETVAHHTQTEISKKNVTAHQSSITEQSKPLDKEGGAVADSSVEKLDTTTITEVSADELVKKAMESKPTAKVVAKLNGNNKKPVKKPKPDPVKSFPKKYLPKVEFDELSYDFGEIVEGDIIKHNFTFTNTGKTNLSIKKATATCGCTKPSFPFIDIEPGETGYIGVTYNSVNKDGDQKPEITVYSNADPKEITLYLKGTVKPKAKKEDEKIDSSSQMKQDTTKQ